MLSENSVLMEEVILPPRKGNCNIAGFVTWWVFLVVWGFFVCVCVGGCLVGFLFSKSQVFVDLNNSGKRFQYYVA